MVRFTPPSPAKVTTPTFGVWSSMVAILAVPASRSAQSRTTLTVPQKSMSGVSRSAEGFGLLEDKADLHAGEEPIFQPELPAILLPGPEHALVFLTGLPLLCGPLSEEPLLDTHGPHIP